MAPNQSDCVPAASAPAAASRSEGQRLEHTGACELPTNCGPRSKRCPERQGGRDRGAAQQQSTTHPSFSAAPGHRAPGKAAAPGPARPQRRAAARPYLMPVVSGQLGLGEEPYGGLGRRPEAQLGLGAGGRQQQEEQEQREQAGQRERSPGRSARHGAERAPPPA